MRFNNQNQPKPGEPSPVWIKELRFTSLQDNSTIGMSHYGTNASTTTPLLEYSRDGEIWTPWFFETLTVNKGDYVLFRGNNPNGISSSSANYSSFAGSGQFSLDGNIMSILYASDYTERFAVTSYCFYSLFYNATIYGTENLIMPATTLASYCYSLMFYNCGSLTTAPELPATELADHCYYSMFSECWSLVNAPALPATTLASYCYSNMFQNCNSLTSAPALPATTLASYCYDSMFSRCNSLVNAPELPATTLANYCYRSMFYSCGLTTAPELPATTLASYCYSLMFYNCNKITKAPATLPATTLADHCYDSMFYVCAALVNAPTLPATTLASYCYNNMFFSCISLTTAPELPATVLVNSCYGNMFDRCWSLTYVKHHIANWNTANTLYWLRSVPSSGIVECPAASTIPSDNVSGIPTGWTRVDITE